MAQDPIVYALPVFFGSIVLEAVIAWRQQRRAYSLADTLTSMNLGTLSQLAAAAAKRSATKSRKARSCPSSISAGRVTVSGGLGGVDMAQL